MVTFSEQLRPFLLCVYLIVLLISLVWYVPELPEGILGNLSWNIGAILLLIELIILIEIIGAMIYLKAKGYLAINAHLIVGIIGFLTISELSMLVVESNVINTSYLV